VGKLKRALTGMSKHSSRHADRDLASTRAENLAKLVHNAAGTAGSPRQTAQVPDAASQQTVPVGVYTIDINALVLAGNLSEAQAQEMQKMDEEIWERANRYMSPDLALDFDQDISEQALDVQHGGNGREGNQCAPDMLVDQDLLRPLPESAGMDRYG